MLLHYAIGPHPVRDCKIMSQIYWTGLYLADRNLTPKPYRWKADGTEILRKIQRAREALEASQEKTH